VDKRPDVPQASHAVGVTVSTRATRQSVESSLLDFANALADMTREAKLALEYNGDHHATRERMIKDSVRALDLQRAQWKILTYTTPQAFDRLDEVVADVYDNLRRRAPHLLTRAVQERRARRARGRSGADPGSE
jgi:very-short-patch-repair endonuclease